MSRCITNLRSSLLIAEMHAPMLLGCGVHRMGNRLAEMQLRVLKKFKRFRKIEVVGEVERNANNFIRASIRYRFNCTPGRFD